MVYIGIDPGNTGAVAYVYGDGYVVTQRLPVIKVKIGDKLRTRLDATLFREWMLAAATLGPVCCTLESVGGMPGQSASAAFNFGANWGRIAEAVEAAGIRLEVVTPQVWRAKLGVYAHARRFPTGDTKDASRAVADQMWPASSDEWVKKGDDGRCEAALLAEYGRRFFSTPQAMSAGVVKKAKPRKRVAVITR